MKLSFNSRKWHAWLSFTLALPILLVAVTAILIAHSQKLGFRDIKVDPSWLPGYAMAQTEREQHEPMPSGAEPLSEDRVKKPMTLARFIRDLHTGEALFGREHKWIWDDIVGGSMTFLALTGIYLWWNGQRKLFIAKRARHKLLTANAARTSASS